MSILYYKFDKRFNSIDTKIAQNFSFNIIIIRGSDEYF
jgi:hypothetical protein